uniref:Putative pumilio 7, chloroplastic n=1 Tax=Anthurium amnicola TaxID=1678845 RepID=A0A1D1Z6H3_9ARAE
MRQGMMREVAEMEVPSMEAARAAPPLLQNQRRPPQGRRGVVEQGMVQLHGHGVWGGLAHQGHSPRLPILEMYDAGGRPAPPPRRDAAVMPHLSLEEPNPVSTPWYASPASGVGQRGELGFLDRLRSLRIGEEGDPEAAAMLGVGVSNPVDPYGIWLRPGDRNPVALPDQEKPVSSSSQQHCHLASSWLKPCRFPHRLDTPSFCADGLCSEPINLLTSDGTWSDLQLLRKDLGSGRNRCQTAAPPAADPLFSVERGEGIEGFLASQKKRTGCSDHFDVSTPPILPQTGVPNSPSGFSILTQQKGFSSNDCRLQPVTPVRSPKGIKVFPCEDSFIIQGNEIRCLTSSNGCGLQRERKGAHTDCRLNPVGAAVVNMENFQIRGTRYLPFLVPKYQSLMDIQGFMSLAAKDQHGCRFLQRKFDEGTYQEKEMIFNEIIDHVTELMVNPFGNYLMQKVLDVCTDDQRLEIIHVLTKDPTELVRISLSMHGTRAVQRLIETLKNRKETALVISALQPGFLSLIKDPNGNHVIQRCLQYFSYDDSKFIFDAAARHCVDIARHRHGCCVLQRCIAHSTGQHQVKLLAEVSRNGLTLAQDAYGNYAVQYILDMKNPLAIQNLKSEFKGKYVHLSMQKFSSNVVEKCLSVFDEIGRRRIISELLSVTCFEQLMQDPYANYVIQAALLVCKGHARSLLVDAIRPHDAVLRTSPYCKRIFNLLKK